MDCQCKLYARQVYIGAGICNALLTVYCLRAVLMAGVGNGMPKNISRNRCYVTVLIDGLVLDLFVWSLWPGSILKWNAGSNSEIYI
jgi:hypothetical protein